MKLKKLRRGIKKRFTILDYVIIRSDRILPFKIFIWHGFSSDIDPHMFFTDFDTFRRPGEQADAVQTSNWKCFKRVYQWLHEKLRKSAWMLQWTFLNQNLGWIQGKLLRKKSKWNFLYFSFVCFKTNSGALKLKLQLLWIHPLSKSRMQLRHRPFFYLTHSTEFCPF